MKRPVICEVFANLVDPRVERTRHHDLIDIVVISVLAVICGADGWEDIEAFGTHKEPWLREFLVLRHGIPSNYTFQRVFAALDVDEFHKCFLAWTKSLVVSTMGKSIAIDGKTLRGSYTTSEKRDPRHIVSAWVGENHIVFGQVATEAKSNEITAIPKLLEMLDVRGATITIDAIGCQKKIVDKIVDRGADYVLSVKNNQPTLHAEIQEAFAAAAHIQAPLPPEATHMSSEKAHGRAEVRRVTAMNVEDYLSCKEDWKGLRSIVLVERERTLGSETSKEVHYYISSHEANAEALGARIRGHWGIENEQHWTLDMAFDEDRCRIRSKNGPDNFALLRRFALNLLKAEKSSKRGIEGKRKKAGWDTTYLLKVLEQVASTYPNESDTEAGT